MKICPARRRRRHYTGVVTIPSGVYITKGTIEVRGDVTLRLMPGVILRAWRAEDENDG